MIDSYGQTGQKEWALSHTHLNKVPIAEMKKGNKEKIKEWNGLHENVHGKGQVYKHGGDPRAQTLT